ncbi:MAG: ATP-binding protein [Limisphaerales bacterium]
MKLLSDFPSGFTLLEQRLDLETLVGHRESVDAETAVESVYQHFQVHPHEYLGVTREGRVAGLVSRGHIGFLLGSRFGFAVYGRQPVGGHLLAQHLCVPLGAPLLDLLDKALSREGDEFYDDVALADASGFYKGIIPVQTLVRLQTRLIADTTRQIEVQRTVLSERNQDLSRSLDELRRSQGRYDILFQNNVLGVALLNHRNQIESHNRRFGVLLGLESSRDPSSPLNLRDLIVPSERAAFTSLVKSQEENGGEDGRQAAAHSGEFRLQLPRLGLRQFMIFVSWIRETGQVCVLFEDVSEQRMLERKLAQKEKSNLLESLVGGIAHELNNKLTPIVMFSEMITSDLTANPDPASLMAQCESIRTSAIEAARIIKQLLQLSKPAKMELASCNLCDIVDDAATILDHRLRQAGVAKETVLPQGGAHVMADAQQIKQVLINVMLNSLDAMEHSRRRSLKIDVARENGHYLLRVADTGCGIAPQNLNRVFDPFFTTKAPDRGTGLGLSVCYTIIKQHGGEMHLQSVPGEGTEVRIRIPAAMDSVVPAEEELPGGGCELSAAAKSSAIKVSGARRVLIVDDEDTIAVMLRSVIRRKLGCPAEWVADGQTAIERLQSDSYDIVISDVRMPQVSGFDLFRWVREHRPELASRFLFITGDAGSIDLNEELETLGVPVLRKPFSMEVLLKQCQLLMKE